jgi:hypothetical protein
MQRWKMSNAKQEAKDLVTRRPCRKLHVLVLTNADQTLLRIWKELQCALGYSLELVELYIQRVLQRSYRILL